MRRTLMAVLVPLIALAACDRGTSPLEPDVPSWAAASADLVVWPGESIQDAVDAARPGATIVVHAGEDPEEVVIDKPGLRIMGVPAGDVRPVLANPGDLDCGFMVLEGGDGVVIQNFVVRGYTENGIYLDGVDGYRLSHIIAEDNGEYGLYPVRSVNGIMEHSVATGHEDAGFYVGQGTDAILRHNEAYGNVIGIEVSTASDIQVVDNVAWGNGTGILLVLQPGLAVKTAARVRVTRNEVRDNNLEDLAGHGLAHFAPPGAGILVIGVDDVWVVDNTVVGNDYVAIGVANSGLLAELAGIPLDVEPFPDHVRVAGNVALGAGGPPPSPLLPPGADLLWDGTGTGTCWTANEFESSLNLNLLGGLPTTELPACDGVAKGHERPDFPGRAWAGGSG
jgi:parallel beta-helix repeat protein